MTQMPVGSLRPMSSRSDKSLHHCDHYHSDHYRRDHQGGHHHHRHHCQNFLRDLLKEASKSQEVTEDKLIEYTDTMVR